MADAVVSPPGDARPATGRIVVGVDGSACSLLALRWALDEGLLRKLPVHAVSSWSMPSLAGMAPVILPDDYDLQSGAQRQLDAILADIADLAARPTSSPVSSAVAEGNPALVLLDAAGEDASLLVVGSRGHGGFAGLLLGSVSQHCAAHARCPVVVVHEREVDSEQRTPTS